jgi:hypothetical protein
MILFFDTETNGLTLNDQPASHPAQPHLVQLAAILTEDGGREVASEHVARLETFQVLTIAGPFSGRADAAR